LKDIAEKEVKKNNTNTDGFIHNPSSYQVAFYNNSAIFTLNSNPDNTRSRRSSLIFFDEAAFCSSELITVVEAFATQNTDFATNIDDAYNPEMEPPQIPTQLVYASSQDTMDTLFYKYYKNFSKRMIAGDRAYFVADMTCDVAIKVYMRGQPYTPLLTQDKVDAALKSNKDKALREYYNKPSLDGSICQIVKWGTIRRNEFSYLPQMYFDKKYKIVLAFDPARTIDNSVVSVMRIYQDAENGWCGDIINCVNMIDTASKKKYKLDSIRQIEQLHEMILRYNGDNPDYEYIDTLLIDQGSGGGGTSTYGDGLLPNWNDKSGVEHRGLIDNTHEIYSGYQDRYPDAIDKIRLISPRKYRTQMVEEFIELMNIGVMHFPVEWNGNEVIQHVTGISNTGEEILESYELSQEEQFALINIDLMKNEITSIDKTTNPENTTVTYALSKEKQNKIHDDRFYTAILLAHRLYELRRGTITKPIEEPNVPPPCCVSAVDF
jgi:hypothetical protein